MTPAVGTITGLALIVGLWLYVHKNAAKTTTALFLVAGIGIGGWFGVALGRWFSTALGVVGTQTALWIGIGTTTLLAGLSVIAFLEVFIKGMWRKKAKPKRWHPWLALALPTIVAAGSVPLLIEAMTLLSDAVNEVGRSITTGIGD